MFGYRIIEKVAENSNTLIYRGENKDTNTTVILKVMKEEYPSPRKIRTFEKEYELLKKIEFPGIIRAYSLEYDRHRPAIIFEDFGGLSLNKIIHEKAFDDSTIIDYLRFSIYLAQIIGQLHRENIIHKDINPANIVWNQKSGEVKIIDFGISTQLNKLTYQPRHPKQLEGTLAYISPEQTGRMNRALDYRTDFYSLGVTLYEMFTGKLPFESSDPMELVHSHLVKSPTPPDEINSSIPSAISQIILKLLEKKAEERYQSAAVLVDDLEECLKQFEGKGRIENFIPGKNNVSDRFQLSQKLYGREEIVKILEEAFQDVCDTGDCELTLVEGYSGVGKTSIIQELYKPVTRKRGTFISGKFDQFERDTPYFSLIQAFKGFIQQLLSESENELNNWKKHYMDALGDNASVITNVIPELEWIIGKQPDVVNLPPLETENRFMYTFKEFIDASTTAEHPLTIFIDDLQWIDSASLKILKVIIESNAQYLHIIGAYRENEVDEGHPLTITVNELKKGNSGSVRLIHIDPLTEDTVDDFLADSFLRQKEDVTQLRKLLIKKTDGNPFFLGEYLKLLYRDELISFDYDKRYWVWKEEEIRRVHVNDNVVDILTARLMKLSNKVRNVLKHASCIGYHFDLNMLDKLYKTPIEYASAIQNAINEGLLITVNDEFDLVADNNDSESYTASYKFAHDRIHQAVYELLDEDERKTIHKKIGDYYLENLSDEGQNSKIFDLVHHLYNSRSILDEKTKNALPGLLTEAGKKARGSAAYKVALKYYLMAIEIIDSDVWGNSYNFALELYENASELANIVGDYEKFNYLASAIKQNVNKDEDLVNVYIMNVKALESQYKLQEAIQATLDALKILKLEMPVNPTIEDVVGEIISIRNAMGDVTPDDLLTKPPMTDERSLKIIEVIESAAHSIMYTGSIVGMLMELKPVMLSLEHGNAPSAPLYYANFGMRLLWFLEEYELAYQFGQLVTAMVQLPENKYIKARAYGRTLMQLTNIKNHISSIISPLLESYKEGIESGDIESATNNLGSIAHFQFHSGMELNKFFIDISNHVNILKKLKRDFGVKYSYIQWQISLVMMEEVDSFEYIKGDYYDEEKMLPVHQQTGDILALFNLYVNKMVVCLYFLQYREVIKITDNLSKLPFPLAPYQRGLYRMVDSLARLGIYNDVEDIEQKQIIEKVEENQKILLTFAELAPMNHMHKYHLVEAERARISGNHLAALEYYNAAISGAEENGFLNEEALSYELTAIYHLKRGQMHAFRHYLRDAQYAYLRWGAKAKIKDLEKRYPEHLARIAIQDLRSTTYSTYKSTTHGTEAAFGTLDFISVLKSSQTISSEIVLEKLLTKLIKILIENAGAQYGFLIIEEDGHWVIRAEGDVDSKEVRTMHQGDIFEKENAARLLLPVSILQYVIRSGDSLVIDKPDTDERFYSDPYIVAKHPKSILCYPFKNQGKMVGVVYLENNIMQEAFSPDRLEVLNFLASQAAISIENAKLYNNINALNQAYERFVPREFLSFLEKKSITDVRLGDQVQKEMSILFSDIRDFTTISETMSPEENFKFVNDYLGVMEPVITDNNGFIDKYIGDAIMALFPGSADDALNGSITMLRALEEYNSQFRKNENKLRIGIGLHTGMLMLGTVGGHRRMDGTVISSAVNTASRLEGLTKKYGVSILITTETFTRLSDPGRYNIRVIGRVKMKGKVSADLVYEVFDGDDEDQIRLKKLTRGSFEQAVQLYLNKNFQDANVLLESVLNQNPQDTTAFMYRKRCEHYMNNELPEEWDGSEEPEAK